MTQRSSAILPKLRFIRQIYRQRDVWEERVKSYGDLLVLGNYYLCWDRCRAAKSPNLDRDIVYF